MSSPRPVVPLNKPRADPNHYRTQCGICGRGIYHSQPARWLTQPLGLSHAECPEKPVSAFQYKVVWPIDEDMPYQQARTRAQLDLENMAEQQQVRLLGEPVFEVREVDPQVWETSLMLVAVVDAMPEHPSREQWRDLVSHYAGLGFNDRQVGERVGLPSESVRSIRRREGIPAGVPVGYHSREQAAS